MTAVYQEKSRFQTTTILLFTPVNNTLVPVHFALRDPVLFLV